MKGSMIIVTTPDLGTGPDWTSLLFRRKPPTTEVPLRWIPEKIVEIHNTAAGGFAMPAVTKERK